jgi:hypothetical protein
MLCTEQQAIDAGCTGDSSVVQAWIAAATVRITRYTCQFLEPTDAVVVADVAPDGLVILPRRVRQITSVTPVPTGSTTPPALPASAYRVTSADTLGQVDAVRIAYGGYDDLVCGAESWAGGWANLLDYWSPQVSVAGSFGLATTPPEAAQACALLAAHMQAQAAPSDADAAQAPGLDVDDEGNNVRIEDEDDADTGSPSASTGLAVADQLLAPYINARPVLGGI